MSALPILRKGIEYTNQDETTKEMMADFKDHKVGIKLDAEDITLVVKDGTISLENGIRDDCHAVMKIKTLDLCGAIDNSFDLMEIREKGEIIKKDPNLSVHLMAIFPFFDAMVRLYQDEAEFKRLVDTVKILPIEGGVRMVRHIVDQEKCQGCGKCVETCSLELWVLKEREDGKKIAQVTDEAAEVCHLCGACRRGCLEQAIIVEEG